MTPKTLLIIEDDPNIADLIQLYAEKDGFRVIKATTGTEGLEMAQKTHPQCIVLDWMLPEMEGLDVLKEIRKTSTVPVLMVTAKSEEIDTLLGLEIGADDYITKPFSPKELMARIKAILRRTQFDKQSASSKPLQIHDLHLDPNRLELKQKSKNIALSPLEFKLIHLLASQPGHVFSRQQLLDKLYETQNHYVFDRTIDAHVKNLRRKLKDTPKKPKYIESVFGVGYKFKE